MDALSGIRVVEWTTAVTGPWAGKCFSDHGAEVVKIESFAHPDVQRVTPPFKDAVPGLDNASQFRIWNTGKYSLTLNLADHRGREVFKELASWADIVIQNWEPGLMKRFGLTYEDLQEINPDIIMIDSSIYGQAGPYGRVATWGTSTAASSGQAYLTGWPDSSPVNPGQVATADVLVPLFIVITALGALEYRRRTGKGQYFDISQLEPMVYTLGPALLDYVVNKRIQGSTGNRDRNAAPHGAFRCKGEDQWCAIAVFSDEEWKNFCQVIGNPEWTRDPKFETLSRRKRNEDELEKLVERWTVSRCAEEVATLMQSAGVPAGKVKNLGEAMDTDSQLKEGQHFVRVEHTNFGVLSTHAWPFRLSKAPAKFSSSPSMGEHNYHVCTEILGMSDEEFLQLLKAGVLE